MNAHERMYQQITEHGENLKHLFHIDGEPVKIAKRVHSLEVKAHRLATDYCNGDIDGDKWDTETEKILNSLDKILNFKYQGVPVFVNGDARGYALKVESDFIKGYCSTVGRIHTDWGGYGILAPEFDGKR